MAWEDYITQEEGLARYTGPSCIPSTTVHTAPRLQLHTTAAAAGYMAGNDMKCDKFLGVTCKHECVCVCVCARVCVCVCVCVRACVFATYVTYYIPPSLDTQHQGRW